MNNLSLILKYTLIVFLGLFLLFILAEGISFYKNNFKYSMYVEARFTELGPVYSSMPVYYKGFKIGKTRKIEPTQDYKYTQVTIILYPQNLSLPENVEAKVEKMDTGKDYIEFVYPKIPSSELLKNGSIIEGKTQADIESFMSAQIESGVFSSMTDNMNKTLNSVQKTSDNIGKFFSVLTATLEENRINLKESTKNTAQTLKNINNISKNLDKALDQQKLKNITSNVSVSSNNIKETTANIKNITKNLDEATKNLDKTTCKLDAALAEAHGSLKNINGITSGLCGLLNKRFAGMRLFFGKPMACKTCPTACSK